MSLQKSSCSIVFNFNTLDISQGSVATHFRCGEFFSNGIITIFSWFWQWNNFENRLLFGKVKSYKTTVPIFWGHPLFDKVLEQLKFQFAQPYGCAVNPRNVRHRLICARSRLRPCKNYRVFVRERILWNRRYQRVSQRRRNGRNRMAGDHCRFAEDRAMYLRVQWAILRSQGLYIIRRRPEADVEGRQCIAVSGSAV